MLEQEGPQIAKKDEQGSSRSSPFGKTLGRNRDRTQTNITGEESGTRMSGDMLDLAPIPDNDDGSHSPRRIVISNRVAEGQDAF